MATKKKLLEAAAGAAAGAGGLNVESLFSTYLYEGNGSANVIDNGINLGQSNDGGSVDFGASGTYLQVPATSDFNIGTSDFTIEMWVWGEDMSGTWQSLISSNYAQSNSFRLYKQASTTELVWYANGSTSILTTSGAGLTNGTWHHIALTRSSGTLQIFVDGVSRGSVSNSQNINQTSYPINIGGNTGEASEYPFSGYISNLRVVNGTAVYTSGFTVPTSALTDITNTVLLTCQGSTPDVDNSSSAHSLTNSNAVSKTFGPFDAASAGEGGMVWLKDRDNGSNSHLLYDTDRGVNKALQSNSAAAELTRSSGLTSFNSSGFSLGSLSAENDAADSFASWTFRKARKFFDVQEWSGDEVVGRQISHNLGVAPGWILVKRTSATRQWAVYHRSQGATKYGIFNGTDAFATSSAHWNDTEPTSTHFTVGDSGDTNTAGYDYVAYLFAHNDGDGDFGPTGDQDIIKCGSYTGNGSATGPEINLGFEPQWFLVKRAVGGTGDWLIVDSMRGMVSGGNDGILYADLSNAELTTAPVINPLPTGFQLSNASSSVNGSGSTYIYIAIRRGPMAVPTAGTDVFDVAFDGATDNKKPYIRSAMGVVDLIIANSRTGTTYHRPVTRLTSGRYLQTTSAAAEVTQAGWTFDFQNGVYDLAGSSVNTNGISWMWKRAPSFCDVVAYSGNSTAGRTVSHNLGVVPEMMWVKSRSINYSWYVYHKDLGNTYHLKLETTAASSGPDTQWNSTTPTDTQFSLGSNAGINESGQTYIAYLFASVDGVSKVGSYTGNTTGTNATDTQNIECGFAPRFVLVKASSTTGQWAVWDTERGIVAGDDPTLYLDSTSAEDTFDFIDPYATGFTITNLFGNYNYSGVTYIFYAVA